MFPRLATLLCGAVFCLQAAGSLAHDLEDLHNYLEGTSIIDEGLNPEIVDNLRVQQILGGSDSEVTLIIREFGLQEEGGLEAVFMENYRWPNGHILKICFFESSEEHQNKTIEIFDSVLEHTNLGLAVAKDACPKKGIDLQIFIQTGACASSASYYGRAAHAALRKTPDAWTMKLCSSLRRGTVQHELMHALSFVHEQQHPDQNCSEELDIPKIGQVLFPGLEGEELESAVRVNLLPIEKSISNPRLQTLPYDRDSIMHYQLRASWFKKDIDPTCVLAQMNASLSSDDMRMLRMMYPTNGSAKFAALSAETTDGHEAVIDQLLTMVAAQDVVFDSIYNACFEDATCGDAFTAWLEKNVTPPEPNSVEIAGNIVGMESDQSLILVTGPKPWPGGGGGTCGIWPVCNHLAATDDAALAIAPINVADAINLMAELRLRPLDPIQEPGPSGGVCGLNPFCKTLIDQFSATLMDLDRADAVSGFSVNE